MDVISIAVDGPAGAGKSTICKIIAEKLNLEYIDTGAMYRAVTLKILNTDISMDDEKGIEDMLNNTIVDLTNGKVYLDGIDVTSQIRFPIVNNNVSRVSAMKRVREKLVHMQREMSKTKSVIMDGRDIGTNVLEDANVKIFLTASVEERAIRRYDELISKDINTSLSIIREEIIKRDEFDSNRELNPLRIANNAVIVDTTGKSIKEVVDEIIDIINNRK